MRRFKSILVLHGTDLSVLERAIQLALAHRASVTVVDIARPLEGATKLEVPGHGPIDLQRLVTEQLQDDLKRTIASLKHDKPRIRPKVLIGNAAQEVIREVIRGKHDLVIMAAEAKRGMRERLFGSTSLRLMRLCPCPVLVLKPAQQRHLRNVLAAVDVDPDDATKNALNATLLDLSSSLASLEHGHLHVVHAWTLYGESLLEGPAGLEPSAVRRIVRQEAMRRRHMAEALASKCKLADATLHVLKGDAADVIPHLVKSLAIDLLVIGTVCRTGVAGFLIGNTAETVLNRVDCSVLAVKPEGFVSPVKLET